MTLRWFTAGLTTFLASILLLLAASCNATVQDEGGFLSLNTLLQSVYYVNIDAMLLQPKELIGILNIEPLKPLWARVTRQVWLPSRRFIINWTTIMMGR